MAKRKSGIEVNDDGQVVNKKSEASKASRQKRRDAIDKLISYVQETTKAEDRPGDVNAAINRLTGKARTSGTTSKRKVVLDYVRENQPVNELDLFKEFQLGRMEMRSACNDLIKKVDDPSDRVWIGFDPESGTYSIKGEGATPPSGWDGYLPPELKESDSEDSEE